MASALLAFPQQLTPDHVSPKVLSNPRMSASWEVVQLKQGGGDVVGVALQLLDGGTLEEQITLSQWEELAEIGNETDAKRRERCVETAAVGVGKTRAEDIWQAVTGLEHSDAAQWLEVMSRPLDQVRHLHSLCNLSLGWVVSGSGSACDGARASSRIVSKATKVSVRCFV